MAEGPAAESSGVSQHRSEVRKGTLTMALYVAISLLASLIVIPESRVEHTHVLGLIWGITLGLALAHWFAFRLPHEWWGPGTEGRLRADIA
jgi:hypothetical protein